jgi:hypothetical protein
MTAEAAAICLGANLNTLTAEIATWLQLLLLLQYTVQCVISGASRTTGAEHCSVHTVHAKNTVGQLKQLGSTSQHEQRLLQLKQQGLIMIV